MSEKSKFYLDHIKKSMPDMVVDDFTMAITAEELFNLPDDWMEFIMVLTTYNYTGHDLNIPIVALDTHETEHAMRIIANKTVKLYVAGHPKENADGKKIIWNMHAFKNTENDKRLFVGGTHLREFCDARNIFYKTFLDNEGLLISTTDLRYLQKDGEDCSLIIKDLRDDGSAETIR